LLFLKILATTRQINKNFEYGSSDPTISGLVCSEWKERGKKIFDKESNQILQGKSCGSNTVKIQRPEAQRQEANRNSHGLIISTKLLRAKGSF
jgi:hypothetical protein